MAARVALLGVTQRERPHALDRVGGVNEPVEFGKVYAQHVGFVWRLLRGMGVPEPMVADAAQDVFLVVHRRLPDFEARHPIKTWLFAITHRIAYKYRHKLKQTREHEPLHEDLRDSAPTPGEAAERRDAERVMMRLLDQLDDQKRVVLVLADFEQLTAPEIAAMTEIPLNTVYTLLRRARIQLSQALAARQKAAP